eukprot:1684491-Pyramimonas_sp.AAC.1
MSVQRDRQAPVTPKVSAPGTPKAGVKYDVPEGDIRPWLIKQKWPPDDPRRCRRCSDGGTVQGYRNQYDIVWN